MQDRGGSITHDDVARVEGVLAVTRAFGNNAMKRVIDAEPEVVSHTVTSDDLYVIIASDGVWDLLSNDDAVRILPSLLLCCGLLLAAVRLLFCHAVLLCHFYAS